MTPQENITQKFQHNYDDWKLNKPAVLIAGRTGAGKSSIVNAIFGKDVAKVGAGRPITQHYNFYAGEFINIYDTRGWEPGAEEEYKFRKDTEKFLSKQANSDTNGTSIDIVWYVVDAPGARFTDFDAELALTAFGGLHVLFILSKCDIAHPEQIQALKQAIEDLDMPNYAGIVEVAANPQPLRGRPAGQVAGLQHVVDETIKALPHAKKAVFAAAQNVDLRQKDAASKTVIRTYTIGAFWVGFAPIPFSDTALLIPGQLILIAHLAYIYGIDISAMKSTSSFISEQIVAALGRGTAGRLLKFLPGAGTLLSGTITGAVAATFTAAIGFAFRTLFHEVFKAKQEGRIIDEILALELLQAAFKKIWADLSSSADISRYDNLK